MRSSWPSLDSQIHQIRGKSPKVSGPHREYSRFWETGAGDCVRDPLHGAGGSQIPRFLHLRSGHIKRRQSCTATRSRRSASSLFSRSSVRNHLSSRPRARGVHPAAMPSCFHIVMVIGAVKPQPRPAKRWRPIARPRSFYLNGDLLGALHKVHLKVRTSDCSGPDTTPVSFVGPWHFWHGGRSISMGGDRLKVVARVARQDQARARFSRSTMNAGNSVWFHMRSRLLFYQWRPVVAGHSRISKPVQNRQSRPGGVETIIWSVIAPAVSSLMSEGSSPAVDGQKGAPSFFDSPEAETNQRAPVTAMTWRAAGR